MIYELRSEDADEKLPTLENPKDLIGSVESLKLQLEDYFDYIQTMLDNGNITEDREDMIKVLRNELVSVKKKNEQLTLANEQLKIQNSHSKDASEDEVEKLMAQVEKYQAMLEEQAEMVAKYDEVLEKEKVRICDIGQT